MKMRMVIQCLQYSHVLARCIVGLCGPMTVFDRTLDVTYDETSWWRLLPSSRRSRRRPDHGVA